LNSINFFIEEIFANLSSNLAVVKTLLNDSSLVQLPNGDGQVFYLTRSLERDEVSISNGNDKQSNFIKKDKGIEYIECSNGVIYLIDSGKILFYFILFYFFLSSNQL